MRRREFIGLVGGAAAWPLAAHTQQGRQPRLWKVGCIVGGSSQSAGLDGISQGMRELGHVDGNDFYLEWRYAEGKYERITALVDELISLPVDILVLLTAAAIPNALRATTTIPIVMGYSVDPVGNGFVASLAHPGANVTGLASSADDSSGKQVEILSSLVPAFSRLGLLTHPDNPNRKPIIKTVGTVVSKIGINLIVENAQSAIDIGVAFNRFTNDHVDGVMVMAEGLFNTQRQQIAELALFHRLPSMFSQRAYVAAGGLTSYGQNLTEFYRLAATYVDRIMRGANPADLPVQQPNKFELVINLKTAEALGLTVPPTLLARADEVIE
jgi:putative tryptophan/tyrosine transport system substrate-binding protein